ncbi:MAG: LLM class F420-dependent oxidoreductase [Actinomycetota bacterium]
MQLGDLTVFVEPQQGESYETILAVAQHAERLGFGGLLRSDHWLPMADADGLPGPTDSWITLAALARETTRIRLGTLVTAATFRHPGPLAVSVAQVDQMSNGRVDFGIGAGWFGAEHAAYGLRFPSIAERFDILEEQLSIITGMWSTPVGETFSFDGRQYSVADSPGLPKPVQNPLPIIVGGAGKRRTPELAARFAHEFNSVIVSRETFVAQRRLVRNACERQGRDPDEMRFSVGLVLCCGEDAAAVERRAAAVGRGTRWDDPELLYVDGAHGTPDQVAASLRKWSDAGADRIHLQTLDLHDHEHLELVASEVAPQLS